MKTGSVKSTFARNTCQNSFAEIKYSEELSQLSLYFHIASKL